MTIVVKQIKLALIEPQADSVEEIVISKAQQAFEILKSPLVVEDSSFGIDELNGFPGPYIKYVLQTVGIDGLLRLTSGLSSRRCRFISALAYVNAAGKIKVFSEQGDAGMLAQRIAPTNIQESWSDLWRIFIPNGASKPLSELKGLERDKIWAKWQERSNFGKLGAWLNETGNNGQK